jgi:hypothetical protein
LTNQKFYDIMLAGSKNPKNLADREMIRNRGLEKTNPISAVHYHYRVGDRLRGDDEGWDRRLEKTNPICRKLYGQNEVGDGR